MKGLLLDTHVFLWWALEPDKLPPAVAAAMQDPQARIVFSAVSSWEAQIKAGLGKLELKEPLRIIVERELVQNRWEALPVYLQHTWKLKELPPLHKDPFDRLLVAQALVEDLAIVTKDPLVTMYPGLEVLWA
jgi:PIN domain nuclease of toxin-antitoxin system